MVRYLGVDPGLSGAFAVLDVADDGTQTVGVTPVPVFQVQATKKRRVYDVPKLYSLLCALQPVSMAYLEMQSARPHQGVTSTFSTGLGFGMWYALLTAAAIPFQVVTPQSWRAKVGLRAKSNRPAKARKEAVRVAAIRRFPLISHLKLDHADAVMLAVCAALEHRE